MKKYLLAIVIIAAIVFILINAIKHREEWQHIIMADGKQQISRTFNFYSLKK